MSRISHLEFWRDGIMRFLAMKNEQCVILYDQRPESYSEKMAFFYCFIRSGLKSSDQVQGQGVPRIGNGAYTLVREYFNSRDNAAIVP